MKIDSVSLTPGTKGTGSIVLILQFKIKNGTIPLEYVVCKWPDKTKIRHAMVCCPFTAILSWLFEREN